MIQIKTLTGKTINYPTTDNTSCHSIKQYIETIENIPYNLQRLVYNGKKLEDTDNIDVTDDITTLHLIVNLRGGMFHESSGRSDTVTLQYNMSYVVTENSEGINRCNSPLKRVLTNSVNQIQCIKPYILSEEDKSNLENINNIILMNYLHNKKSANFDPNLWECMKYIHLSPNKEEICKNWIYGVEFMVIDNRHCNGNMFYHSYKGWLWEESFCTDFLLQIYLINVPHRDITDEFLNLLHKINFTLRITLKAGMNGSPLSCEKVLGSDFQKILDFDPIKRNAFLNLWKYKDDFNGAIKHNSNGKEYYRDDPEMSYMSSFVTSFIMNLYH